MKKIVSIFAVCFIFAFIFPSEAPAPITTTIPEPTIAPASVTGCPVVITECAMVVTECPAEVTTCIEEPTECPATVTECVEKPTECPALLNAASPDVSYDLDEAAIINMFNGVYPDGPFNPTKDVLENFNEQGCPID